VAEPDVRDVRRHAVDQRDFQIPVELVGFAECKTQRHADQCQTFSRRSEPFSASGASSRSHDDQIPGNGWRERS
jgi:hypothetical protein